LPNGIRATIEEKDVKRENKTTCWYTWPEA
jgi:hypothetical protein